MLGVTLASHGASGLSPDLYRLSVLTDHGARYGSRCGYVGTDPCDGIVQISVDGAASRTVAFQIPAGSSGSILYDDGRYPTSSDFTLD